MKSFVILNTEVLVNLNTELVVSFFFFVHNTSDHKILIAIVITNCDKVFFQII